MNATATGSAVVIVASIAGNGFQAWLAHEAAKLELERERMQQQEAERASARCAETELRCVEAFMEHVLEDAREARR